MANDMSSAMSMLKGILGDNAEEKIQSVMQSFAGGDDEDSSVHAETVPSSVQESSGFDDNTLQYILQMKSIVDEMSKENDDRSRLLLSLRPYMREQRQKSIDSALKLMALTKLSGVFKKL